MGFWVGWLVLGGFGLLVIDCGFGGFVDGFLGSGWFWWLVVGLVVIDGGFGGFVMDSWV